MTDPSDCARSRALAREAGGSASKDAEPDEADTGGEQLARAVAVRAWFGRSQAVATFERWKVPQVGGPAFVVGVICVFEEVPGM